MGYQQAGRAAKMEGALTARNIKEQAKIRRLQALQEHNDIMANLQTFKAQNAAIAGTTGRDMGSDRSYKALLKANNLSKAYRYKAFGSIIGGAYKASTMTGGGLGTSRSGLYT